MSALEPDLLRERFAERQPGMSRNDALVAAHRCLYCFDAPCIVACPTSIDIPAFIRKVETGDRLGAAQRIMEANVLGASCARVCAVEELCEGACVVGKHERPVEIGRLQRYSTDLLLEEGIAPFHAGAASGESVGIVGAGPAGIAAAVRLREAGHAVTIYERREHGGGLCTYGIIPLRQPRAIIDWEVQTAVELGVELQTGVAVGSDVSAAELLDRHGAVFLAIGAGAQCSSIGIDLDPAAGIVDALDWIAQVRTQPLETVPCGRRVVVVGAGNTGMDACSIAVRLGAEEVICVYRRTAAEMTGYPDEYRHVRLEGVGFRWLSQPIGVETDGGRVTGLRCAAVRLGEPDGSGRPRPQVDLDDQVVLPCDMVVLATGQQREPSLFEEFGLAVDGTRPIVDPVTLASSDPRVFCGGDCVLAGDDLAVVDASAQGNRAAAAIDALLRGNN